jgi:hypothetical protein
MGAWYQDGLADWLSVVMWLWLPISILCILASSVLVTVQENSHEEVNNIKNVYAALPDFGSATSIDITSEIRGPVILLLPITA